MNINKYFMKKIIFLIINKATLSIIFYFIIQKFINLIIKHKIKRFKRDHQFFIKKKKISSDYFSMNAYNFYNYLNKLKSNFKYLEIGSFEGNSAIFIAEKFKDSKIYCVDIFGRIEDKILMKLKKILILISKLPKYK